MWTRKIQRKIKLIPSHQFYFSSYTERLTDGCWSPSRPSVFFVTRQYFKTILDPSLSRCSGRMATWTPGTSSTSRGPPSCPSRSQTRLWMPSRWSSCPHGSSKCHYSCPKFLRFKVKGSWWLWAAMTATQVCWSSAPASASAAGEREREIFDINFNHGSLGLKKLQPQKCLNERQEEKKS